MITSPGAALTQRSRIERQYEGEFARLLDRFLSSIRADAFAHLSAGYALIAATRSDPFAYTNVRKRWRDAVTTLATRRDDILDESIERLLVQSDLPYHVTEDVMDLLAESHASDWSMTTTKRHLTKMLTPSPSATGTHARYKRAVSGLARTAATMNFNRFQNEEMLALGVTSKRWVSRHDDRVRPTHREADGQVVPVDEDFTVGTSRLAFPGDPTAPIEEIAYCRCLAVPVPD